METTSHHLCAHSTLLTNIKDTFFFALLKGLDELKISRMIGETIDGVTFLEGGDTFCANAVLRYEDDLDLFMEQEGVLSVPYGPYDSPYDEEHWRDVLGNRFPHIDFDLSDGFIDFLRKLIAPADECYKPALPKADKYICVHVRTGRGFDTRAKLKRVSS